MIKEYDKFIDYWISQKDNLYLMHGTKELKLSTGDYICFLNAGDFFTKNSLEPLPF